MDEYPHACEIDAVVAAAVTACDAADGLIDGIVSDSMVCKFDPFFTVGTRIIALKQSQYELSRMPQPPSSTKPGQDLVLLIVSSCGMVMKRVLL